MLSLTEWDSPDGPLLCAAGWFDSTGGQFVHWIAGWDGGQWRGFDGGMDDVALCVHAFDDGTGEALYAGGYLTTAGTQTANQIARWDGTEWSLLGTGTDGNGAVFVLQTFDDGSGPALYAGGDSGTMGGVATGKLARWDGSAWSAVGGKASVPNRERRKTGPRRT